MGAEEWIEKVVVVGEGTKTKHIVGPFEFHTCVCVCVCVCVVIG